LQKEEQAIDLKLQELRHNDPEEMDKVRKLTAINKEAADRWTDNLWVIKAFLTKKKGMAGKEADKVLKIDSSFDYPVYEPPKPVKEKKAKN
jgi:hypothetical protein